MNNLKHRYSHLINPLIFSLDSLLVFYLYHSLIPDSNLLYFLLFLIGWFVISYFTGFYRIYRNTRLEKVFSLLFYQLFIYNLLVITIITFSHNEIINKDLIIKLLKFDFFIMIVKFIVYALLKYYRFYNHNLRNYLILGYNTHTRRFQKLLQKRKDFGFNFKGYIKSKSRDNFHLDAEELEKEIITHNIDVLFCSLKELSDNDIEKVFKIANNHFVKIKFIPDNKEIVGKKHSMEYYDFFPVLSIRQSPLDKIENKILKRTFDLIFSSFIIIFILSWLHPILGLLIKLESKGPVIFRQQRNGLNYEPFQCYKFRSMKKNKLENIKATTRNDSRITKLGKYIRKTSIDELPQFYNVFLGNMSVVGPRPHMTKENEKFKKIYEKYMGRHYVKPGITGLAQVKGYRGEVKTTSDIINRVRYDLFYIENWSFWLDIKIILLTLINMFKGDKKAY